MYIADPHQSRNIGLVRLSGKGISEEDNCLDHALSHPTADDKVASFRPMSDPFNIEPQLIMQQLGRMPRGNEFLSAEELNMLSNELDHRRFLLIVSD